MLTAEFDYPLPDGAIAQHPAEPRDSARLLVTDGLVDTTFDRLGEFLRPGDLLVLNDVRVRAARLEGERPGGGKVEILLLGPHDDGHWDALARPARKLRKGMVLTFPGIEFAVTEMEGEGMVRLRPESAVRLEERIEAAGTVPLPPYIHRSISGDRYQTVYADGIGAAAAPTAGLHFTPQLLASLRNQGIQIETVTLEVGLGTFRPIATEAISEHEMHAENYLIPADLPEAVAVADRVVAVGTTTVRALESAWSPEGVVAGRDRTNLFISPGYRPRVVDTLITNFHMPRSSLLVMIAAFLPGWRAVYGHAVANGYRFLSFGDAMLIPDVRPAP